MSERARHEEVHANARGIAAAPPAAPPAAQRARTQEQRTRQSVPNTLLHQTDFKINDTGVPLKYIMYIELAAPPGATRGCYCIFKTLTADSRSYYLYDDI